MIRIASPFPQGKRKAAPVEDASTWPTNRPQSVTGKAAKPAKPEKASQGARREIYAAPASLKQHGTSKTERTIKDTVQAVADPALLTSRFALLALALDVLTDPAVSITSRANKRANVQANSKANKRAVAKRKASALPDQTPAIRTLESGNDVGSRNRLDSLSRAKQAKLIARRTYQADLMRRRRAASKFATVIL